MRPLDDILVVAMEQAVAAPYCTGKLAQAGARVIKIERAEGDFARGYDTAAKGDSSYFAWLNQGKESVCLNIKDADDFDLLKAMIQKADVFVQNFAPGAMTRAGLGPDVLDGLNPRLITCNISGYGTGDAVAGKRGYDLLVQAESALIAVSGAPDAPGRVGVSVCDVGSGMTAYYAILEALIMREKTGEGSVIDISLFDMTAEWMTVPYIHAAYGKGAPPPVGLRHPSIAPYGAFECGDGRLVLISIQNEREWVRLCEEVLKAPALAVDERFSSNNLRVENRDALEADMSAITRAMSSEEFQARLEASHIAYGAVNQVDDLPNHPAFRGQRVRASNGEEMTTPASPAIHSYDRNDGPPKAPAIGEHNDQIRHEFLKSTDA